MAFFLVSITAKIDNKVTVRAVAEGGRRGRDTPPTKMRCRQINYLSVKCCLLDDFYWYLYKALTPSQNLKQYIIFNW